MRLYIFYIFVLLLSDQVFSRNSFKQHYEQADVKIKYKNGRLEVVDGNNTELTKKKLQAGETIDFNNKIKFCIRLTEQGELSIERIDNSEYFYAINSDTAVSIAGNNNIDGIAVKSTSYITNIGNLCPRSANFYTKLFWNFGGLGEVADFDATPTINVADYVRDYSGFYNQGVVNYDDVYAISDTITQMGTLKAGTLSQHSTSIDQPATIWIKDNEEHNRKTYTKINNVIGTQCIHKKGKSVVNIGNFRGEGTVTTKEDGSLVYKTTKKELLADLTPRTSRESCGIPNLSRTCHYNAAIQLLYAIDTLRDQLLDYTGNDPVIVLCKKLFKCLHNKQMTKEEIESFLRSLYGINIDIYSGGSELCDLDLFLNALDAHGITVPTSFIMQQHNSIDARFIGPISERGSTMSQLIKNPQDACNNEKIGMENFHDYIINASYTPVQITLDNLDLEGNAYEPIAAISSNDWHEWTIVKQLDGTFMEYNDDKVTEVNGFNDEIVTVVYKRIVN